MSIQSSEKETKRTPRARTHTHIRSPKTRPQFKNNNNNNNRIMNKRKGFKIYIETHREMRGRQSQREREN